MGEIPITKNAKNTISVAYPPHIHQISITQSPTILEGIWHLTNDTTINKSSQPGFLTNLNRVYSRSATVIVARQRKTIPTGRAYILLG